MRTVLGKPAAVFMPSGTMAQQIALRIHADRRGVRTVAFPPPAHLALHEDTAYQRLHGLVGLKIGDPRGLITIEDLRGVGERLAAVLFELPQREIGGRLPSWSDLEEQVAFVRARGAALHLDGARLWECTPHYDRSPAAIAALFDTVYVSLYKGLGGLAGCCLAGEEEVIAEARAWRRRHGGTLFGLLAGRGVGARRAAPAPAALAALLRACARHRRGSPPGPEPRGGSRSPPTPMMHLHLRVEAGAFLAAARRLAEERSLFTWARSSAGATPSIRVVELTVGATRTSTPARPATR